ncbi:MAG: hypothetical protein WB626_00665 [Bacteroidota bacterium]
MPPELDIAVPDTSYVPLYPSFAGFTGPEDILVGQDQLLYVADTRGDRLVMLNRAGQVLSERRMLRPRSVAQDSRLDLLVGGEVVASSGDTVGALFRIHLYSPSPDSAHRLEVARVDTIWRELARPARRFPGITVFGDNQYLVVRTGPSNTSFIDPDGRVLLFRGDDTFSTPVSDLWTGTGSGITTINKPTAIASFPGSKDFVLAQSSEGVTYGAVWMYYKSDEDFQGWLPKFNPDKPEERFIDFIRPNRYRRPEAVAIDRAAGGSVFVADAELDSVFKFTGRGRLKAETFGKGRTDGLMLMPTGLAFFQRVLYVLDGERGEILRFRLSTDVPR